MKPFTLIAIAIMSFPAFSQTCQIDLVDSYQNPVRSFYGSDLGQSCYEAMRDCRKTIRIEPELGGVDCINVEDGRRPVPAPPAVDMMDDIQLAVNYAFDACHVLPLVDGWANQLYVNGKFVGNFRSGSDDLKLSRAIREYRLQGKCTLKSRRQLNYLFDPSLIRDARENTLSSNCYVKPQVDGWADQLFVDGKFVGNFHPRNEEMKLRSAIAGYIDRGVCRLLSNQEKQLMRDPYLVNDFANYQYRGCHVKLNVSGYNQVYVRNQFKGNFLQKDEALLRGYLVKQIMNGTCQYNPL
jgi:hypothetical protein